MGLVRESRYLQTSFKYIHTLYVIHGSMRNCAKDVARLTIADYLQCL